MNGVNRLLSRKICVILIFTVLFTMIPVSFVNAASRPGKVKIKSISSTQARKKDNKGTITVKWKKASKATGYWIYLRHDDGSWKVVKKTGKSARSAKIKALGGKVYVKVRAVRKRGSKKVKGKYSAVKSAFVASQLSLEEYYNLYKKEWRNLKAMFGDEGGSVKVVGNVFMIDIDLPEDTEPWETEELQPSDESEWAGIAYALKNMTGVRGVKVTVNYYLDGERIYYETVSA